MIMRKLFEKFCLNRCCFCIPARYGLLICGITKLLYTITLTPWMVHIHTYDFNVILSKSIQEYPLKLVIFIWLLELIWAIMLLVGIIKKNQMYLKMYYYYAIVIVQLSILGLILSISLGLADTLNTKNIILKWIQVLLEIINICFQFYLIVLIKIKTSDYNSEESFINNYEIMLVDNNLSQLNGTDIREKETKSESMKGLNITSNNINEVIDEKSELNIVGDRPIGAIVADIIIENRRSIKDMQKLKPRDNCPTRSLS